MGIISCVFLYTEILVIDMSWKLKAIGRAKGTLIAAGDAYQLVSGGREISLFDDSFADEIEIYSQTGKIADSC